MRRLDTVIIALTAAACTISQVKAESRNPYSGIFDRNSFSLKPIPPPPPDTPPPAPPVPLAKVVLTGVLSIFGPPRVTLEITEQEQGKAAIVSKPVLKQGERDGSVEVLFIDMAANSVRIRNGTVETNITFEVVKSGPTPGGAVPLMPNLNLPGATIPAQPTIISPAGVNSASRAGAGAPTFYGASTMPAPTGAADPNSGYASVSTYGAGGGLTRPVRTDGTPTAQEVYQRMRQQQDLATKNNIPMPPLPPSPHLGTAGAPPSLPGNPNVYTGGGPPGLPGLPYPRK